MRRGWRWRWRRHLAAFLKTEVGPNLWHIHRLSDVPVFQIDANFGFTAAVAEMLAQGDGRGRIDLLPAIPEAWRRGGAFSGLKVRGGYTVSCRWHDGKIVSFSAEPPRGGSEAEVYAFGRLLRCGIESVGKCPPDVSTGKRKGGVQK